MNEEILPKLFKSLNLYSYMPQVKGVLSVVLSVIKEKPLGRSPLIKILKGAKTKEMIVRNFFYHPGFGAFCWLKEREIAYFIEELRKRDYLRFFDVRGDLGVNFPVYKLYLTEKGKTALDNKEDLTVDIPDEFFEPLKPLSSSAKETIALFRSRKSFLVIAEERRLALSTVFSHFEEGISHGLLRAEEIVDSEKILQIQTVLKKKHYFSLKEIKQDLPENISYGEIRCVTAERRNKGDQQPI